MGFYINPPNETKEAFLWRFGEKASEEQVRALEAEDYIQGKTLPVCLVLNSAFSAAAIVYGPSEFKVFTSPEDHRAKSFYFLPKKELSRENGADEVPDSLLGA